MRKRIKDTFFSLRERIMRVGIFIFIKMIRNLGFMTGTWAQSEA